MPVLAMCVACTPRAVSPQARTFVMESPAAPAAGHGDAQIDFAGVGTVWGPTLDAAGGTMRRTVSDQVVIEGNAGLLHVANNGDGGDRNAYTGRAGVLLRENPEAHSAMTIGLGGGYSPVAGTWGSVDVGGVLSGRHKWIRPLVAANIGYAGPIATTPFTVMYGDNESATLRLPHNITTSCSLGVELGPTDTTFFAGLSFAQFWLLDSSRVSGEDHHDWGDDFYAMLGLGVRIATD